LLRTRRSFDKKMLMEVCLEIDPDVTERTIANDISFLRDILHAPLPEKSNKWSHYQYTEDYSIFEGLDQQFTGALNEVLSVIRQLSRKKEFRGLEDLLLRLEQRASTLHAEENPLILFEEPELKGRQYLLPLYRYILEGNTLELGYAPFNRPEEVFRVRPLLLKEFNKRWYLFAWKQGEERVQHFPLDRIVSLNKATVFLPQRPFNAKVYFNAMLGVTNLIEKPEMITVRLRFLAGRGKYVITKKIHPEQDEKWETDGSLEVTFRVRHNPELETKILEFGAGVEVVEPKELRRAISGHLRRALAQYQK